MLSKEYRTKTPDSGPHGLAADKDGNIWFTASFQGYIGKLDPKTGTIIEYHLPDPAARDPHTPVFDRTGVLWFTVQGANMVGRLVPQTGEVMLQPVPTPNALPYGIAVNSAGVPVLAEFGSNKLASIDPATMTIHEYTLPNPESRPRRIAITPDDAIWYTDYAGGHLGRFDPKTRQRERVAFAWWRELGTLWDRRREGRFVVQRVGCEPEHPRAVRSEDGEVSNLGYSFGGRGGAQYDGDEGRQPRPSL